MSLDELTEKYNTGFLDYDIDNLRAFVQTLYPLIEKEEDAAKFVVYLKVSTTTSQTDNNNDKKAVIKKVEALDGFDFAEDNIRRYATELDKFLKEIQGKTNNTKIEYEKSLSRQWISFEYESSTHKFVIVNIFLSDISSSKSNAPYMTFYGKAVKEQIEAILKSKNKDFVSSNNNVSVNISNLNFGDDEELLKQLIDVELERRSK